MQEIKAIAGKKGIALPENITETAFDKGRQFPHQTKTSFQRDYKKKDKPDERDIFGGTIIRMSEELGTAANTTQDIYRSLQETKH